MENESKINSADKEGDITFDEQAWNEIVREVNILNPITQFKDIQNGSLILNLKGE